MSEYERENADLSTCNLIGRLSWSESPFRVKPGSRLTRDGKTFVVLRCERLKFKSDESLEWSLAMVEIEV